MQSVKRRMRSVKCRMYNVESEVSSVKRAEREMQPKMQSVPRTARATRNLSLHTQRVAALATENDTVTMSQKITYHKICHACCAVCKLQ